MAIRLEKIGWGTADSWVRMQAAYELAQARRDSDKIIVHPVEASPA
jgi:plasmid maintenance system antidote protein VapI